MSTQSMIMIQPLLSGRFVAGVSGTITGWNSTPVGSGMANRGLRTYTVDAVVDDTVGPFKSVAIFTFGPAIAQDYFNAIALDGAVLLTSAATSFLFSAGVATWKWAGSWGLVNGSTYNVVFS